MVMRRKKRKPLRKFYRVTLRGENFDFLSKRNADTIAKNNRKIVRVVLRRK
jgi:hypothetical protein